METIPKINLLMSIILKIKPRKMERLENEDKPIKQRVKKKKQTKNI